MVWNGVLNPLSGNTRLLVSRLILNDDTRVTSAEKASTCRSNISLTWSSHESGTPIGRRRQLALLAAGVALLDLLDAPLDLADALEIGRQPRLVARARGRAAAGRPRA